MAAPLSNIKQFHPNTFQVFLRVVALLFFLLMLTQAAGPVVSKFQQAGLIRNLLGVILRLPEKELIKPIPCSRVPLADGADKTTLQQTVAHLVKPDQRAIAYCLLGDYPSALTAYAQAASAGDESSALQVYFLEARQGNMAAAARALSGGNFSLQEINNFFDSVNNLKLNIDLLPVARRAVELYPGSLESWYSWRSAIRVYENTSRWQSALDAYLEGLQIQEKMGVSIGLSSFEVGRGRIYQTRPEFLDLKTALSCYNRAIVEMKFLDPNELSNVYRFRGEVYRGLGAAYTATQVLQEFLHALDLNPQNYWALYDIASYYLNNLKDFKSAETYINQTISSNPANPDAYLLRGDLYRQQGNLPAAIDAYQDALARQPGYQNALARLAAVQAEMNKKTP